MRRHRQRRLEEAEKGTVTQPYEEERIEWPPPRPDPDREPSHPGARDDDEEEAS